MSAPDNQISSTAGLPVLGVGGVKAEIVTLDEQNSPVLSQITGYKLNIVPPLLFTTATDKMLTVTRVRV